MWLIKVYIIAVIALWAAQATELDASTTSRSLPTTTLLPMSSITPSLRVDPPAGHIYAGERAVLRCGAKGGSPDRTYLWYHNDQGTALQSSDPSLTSYTIDPAALTHGGEYWCRIKGAEELSAFSDATSLDVIAPPRPSLELQTQWLDVFPTERVELSCGVQDSSDWTYTWYRDGTDLQADDTVSVGPEGSTLTVPSATKTHSGDYSCRGQHRSKPVITSYSNSLPLQVYANKPQPAVTQTPGFDQMYIGEAVSFTCRVHGSTGWEYLWYKDGAGIQTTSNYTITSPQPSSSGQYWCQAKRGKGLFHTENSDMKTLQFSAPPRPSLKQKTQWLDVFPTERVELSCGVQDSSDWTYTWYRDGTDLQADNTVSVGPEGSTLTIPSATQTHEGLYTCKGHHKTRKVSSEDSQTTNVRVYGNKPTPSLSKDPYFKEMYVGESVTFSCKVDTSSGWEYLWYKDGGQLPTSDTNMTISPTPSDGGTYNCKAKRGKEEFYTEGSDLLALHIIDIPVPSLELQTQWLDVFPTERVELSCGVQDSSDWTYTWYRDGQMLGADHTVFLDAEGSSLTIVSAEQDHAGGYTCEGQHRSRPVKTKSSSALTVIIHANKPKPLMTQSPNVEKIYMRERVSFNCRVAVSSGWEYLWYRNGTQLLNSNTGNSFTIDPAIRSNSGSYHCMAKRGKTIFNTEYSEVRTLRIIDIPVPSLELQTQWLDVFRTERVELSCRVQGSSDWTYTWHRDGADIPAKYTVSDGASFTIRSVLPRHAGMYICGGRHKTRLRRISTKRSSGLTLKVYDSDEFPKPMLTRDPGFKPMYVGESVLFSCRVNVSSGWEFLWVKDGQALHTSDSTYSLTSTVLANTGEYQCQAKRGQKTRMFQTDLTEALNLHIQVRPWTVVTLLTGWSEVFSTDSLVLRCDVQESRDLWNYTWFREGTFIHEGPSDRYTVTPDNDPNQNQYTCQGIRTLRPLYSTRSEPFKTKNLLLKRRVLLSISGCLFFGIVSVFIGCFFLRVTRKPVREAPESEEPNLFLTMAELKTRLDLPSPVVDCTEAALITPTKEDTDADENGTICSESTLLCISPQADQAVTSENLADNNRLLLSFKQ